ncbi:hypothetical protein PSHT_06596 [Puccinia striiformis]|uniref:Uncharacterized protein n=1 Tax=Puccinia striiformis TaxID=27350 RepID=A0A2S4W467_9BASI|nr:hypothetical protein PSHT_06596 [Puccinia striiformis]
MLIVLIGLTTTKSPTSVPASVISVHGHNNFGYGNTNGHNGNRDNLVIGCMESLNCNVGSGVAYSNSEFSSGGIGGVSGNLGSGGTYNHGDLISGGVRGLNTNLGSAGAYFNHGNFGSGRMSDVGFAGMDRHVGNLGLRSTYGENVNPCSGDIFGSWLYVSGNSGHHSNVSDEDMEDNNDLENGLGDPEEDMQVVTPIYTLCNVYLPRVHTNPQVPAKSTALEPEGILAPWLTNITGQSLKCFGAGAALSGRCKLQDCLIDNKARNTLSWTVWIVGNTFYPKAHPVTLDTNIEFEQFAARSEKVHLSRCCLHISQPDPSKQRKVKETARSSPS